MAHDGGNRREQHAEQQNKPSRLRAGRQESSRRQRRALINIGRPDLERERRNLESQTNHHHQQSAQEDFVVHLLGHRRNVAEVKLPRDRINQRNAKNSKRGRERADDQVLHASLKRAQSRALKAGQNVKRDRDQFERDKQESEIIG